MTQDKSTEWDVLDQAIDAVGRETGLRLKVVQRETRIGEYWIDAIVQVGFDGQQLIAEIKKWAQQANLGAMINQVKNLPEEGLLVADYVNPQMADKLRQQGVQFIDAAGNVFINQLPVYLYVTGKKVLPAFNPTKDGAKRAFEPTALKVVYAFLCRPELINATYREIAKTADVALGTVGRVLNGLKAADLIRERKGKNGRRLISYRKLFDRWVEAYPEKLKPKLKIGEFIARDPYWWKDFNIREYDGCWGGEIAAAFYTKYLKPVEAIVYMPEYERNRLLNKARLHKATDRINDEPGNVHIYKKFWPDYVNEEDEIYEINKWGGEGLVHPVLAYADLVATGDPRNMEAARMIYDEYIAQHCRED